MHHILLDRWSQGASPLHRRDARAKIVALLVFLILLATTPGNAVVILITDAALLASAILIAGLPLMGVLLRAMVVLPFSLTFGLINWLAGEPARALALVEKSYLSTIAVLLLAGTTPLPLLLGGLETLGNSKIAGVGSAVPVSLPIRSFRTSSAHAIGRSLPRRRRSSRPQFPDFALPLERWQYYSRDLTTEPRGFIGPCKRADSPDAFRFSILNASARWMPRFCSPSPHFWSWCAWDDAAD